MLPKFETWKRRTHDGVSRLEGVREMKRRATRFEDGVHFNQHNGLNVTHSVNMCVVDNALQYISMVDIWLLRAKTHHFEDLATFFVQFSCIG